MGLMEQARQDALGYITGDWSVSATLQSPNVDTVTVNLIHTKHHLEIDLNTGKPINGRNAHVTFSEASVGDYPLRNRNGEVDLKGHLVKVKDSTGTEWTYAIREWMPDETLGTITCILGDYE